MTNAKGVQDNAEVQDIIKRSEEMNAASEALEQEVWNIALSKMK